MVCENQVWVEEQVVVCGLGQVEGCTWCESCGGPRPVPSGGQESCPTPWVMWVDDPVCWQDSE